MKSIDDIKSIDEQAEELEQEQPLTYRRKKSKFEVALRDWLQKLVFDFNDWVFEKTDWQNPVINLTSETWEFANKCLQKPYLTVRQEESIWELYCKLFKEEGLEQIIIDGEPENKEEFFKFTNERINKEIEEDDDKYYKEMCFG
jgi:hypothetical protein